MGRDFYGLVLLKTNFHVGGDNSEMEDGGDETTWLVYALYACRTRGGLVLASDADRCHSTGNFVHCMHCLLILHRLRRHEHNRVALLAAEVRGATSGHRAAFAVVISKRAMGPLL